jgi:hypothetical protein
VCLLVLLLSLASWQIKQEVEHIQTAQEHHLIASCAPGLHTNRLFDLIIVPLMRIRALWGRSFVAALGLTRLKHGKLAFVAPT